MKFASSLSKLVIAYLLLQTGLTFGLIYFARTQHRQLASVEIEEVLLVAARGLQPTIEPMLDDTKQDRSVEIAKVVQTFNAKTDIRVTVIRPDGSVVADSDADARTMVNHQHRAEVIQASHGKIGKATRMSESTKTEYHYLAIPLKQSSELQATLRLAMPTARIQKRLSDISHAFIGFALASAAVASLLIIIFARAAISPLQKLIAFSRSIAKGDYEQHLSPTHWRGEWRLLGNAFDQMQVELKNREIDLRTNSDRLSSVLASMSEGIIAIDERRRVLLANRAASVLFEVPLQELLNRSFYELVRSPKIEACVEEVFQTRQTVAIEFENKRLPRRVLSLRASWISQYEGKAVLMVVHDVTSLRALETMRRDFVANVSHELKTPLSSIKAYSETLLSGAINDPSIRLRFIERIEEQANRLSDLILDLIRLANIESGEAAFEMSDVDLARLARLRIETYRDQAEMRQISLAFEQTQSKIFVRCDEEGLATIIDNLVSNAVRYTPLGGKVVVRCSIDAAMGVIDVVDNGQGIAAEHQERIFERFYRVDKARSSDLGGTGLGLSIVKHLAQSFSGQASVSSRLGKGTTFTVRLPLGTGQK